MTLMPPLTRGLAITALALCATTGWAEDPVAVDLDSWNETFAAIKAVTPKWSKQESVAFKASLDAGVPMWFLDLRSPKEWTEKGVIQGATLISIEELATPGSVAQLPEDKSTIIAVYCSSGHRSAMVLPMLRQMGYTNAIVMSDGYDGWAANGYPVIAGPS